MRLFCLLGKMFFLRAAVKEKEKNEKQEQRTEPVIVSQEEPLSSASKYFDLPIVHTLILHQV